MEDVSEDRISAYSLSDLGVSRNIIGWLSRKQNKMADFNSRFEMSITSP